MSTSLDMKTFANRTLAQSNVHPIGLGCMSLSTSYGPAPDRAQAIRLLNTALDMGYNNLDTASLYGIGHNESLIAEAIGHRRSEYFLGSKCGLLRGPNGRLIDGRPETLARTIDESLSRLGTDHIDLYTLHRLDPKTPIEESVGALADMVKSGKIGAIGLSEISAATLRRAHAEHPIAAVQNEYSLWSRNCELGILQTTKELGVALVAFSPVGRGWLAGAVHSEADIRPQDLRRSMPRFNAENLQRNSALFADFSALAAEHGFTPAQLSLAWVLAQGDHLHVIPGTASIDHLAENFQTPPKPLPARLLSTLSEKFAPSAIFGTRYNDDLQADIDTEEFA